MIANILVNRRVTATCLWFTFTSESAWLTPRTMQQLKDLAEYTKAYSKVFWRFKSEQLSQIKLNKVDTAVDL